MALLAVSDGLMTPARRQEAYEQQMVWLRNRSHSHGSAQISLQELWEAAARLSDTSGSQTSHRARLILVAALAR